MLQNLEVLLVTPPSKTKVFQDLAESLTGIEPPVWSTLLATFLRQKGVSVEIWMLKRKRLGLI